MRNSSILLAILLLLQSCSVYNIPTSVESAVNSDTKVKIFTKDDRKYKFKRLENENDRLIGITKRGSSTAKKLAGMPATIEGKFLRIDLSDVEIEEIMRYNKSSSTLLTIATVAGSLIVAYFTLFLIAMDSFLEESIILPVN